MSKRPVRVSRFSIEGLPRVPRSSLPGTLALARSRAYWPAEFSASLKRLGALSVQVTRVSFLVPADPDGASFTLTVRGEQARLTVEPLLALRLVASVLGAPAPIVVRPLGRAERGALAALVCTFADAVHADGAIRVALEDAGPIEGREVVSVELGVKAAAFVGSARVDVPARLLATGVRPLAVDPRLLAPLVVVELARTSLPLAAFTCAVAGDMVVFDGVAPAPADRPWSVQLQLGGSACGAVLEPDGTLRRHGPLTRNESETRMSKSTSDAITAPAPTLSLSEEASRALASATVEIVAEIGRLTVRGDELVGLVDGGVLALGPRRPAAVVLRVSGRVWAHGELVAVDDELGVRVTELVK